MSIRAIAVVHDFECLVFRTDESGSVPRLRGAQNRRRRCSSFGFSVGYKYRVFLQLREQLRRLHLVKLRFLFMSSIPMDLEESVRRHHRPRGG